MSNVSSRKGGGMSTPYDGRYYANRQSVFKAPAETMRPDGTSGISLGFPVCEVSDFISGDGPDQVADLMNAGAALPAVRSALEALLAAYIAERDVFYDTEATANTGEIIDPEAREALAEMDALIDRAREALASAEELTS